MNIHSLGRLFQSLNALHWFVLVLSLMLTLGAWQISSRIAEEKTFAEFDHQVTQITEQLKDRMANYAFALVSGTGTIQAQSQGLTWPEWRRFSESLALPERLPGINGIGVIYRVAPDNLDSFIADQRGLRPEFRVHPPHEQKDYWPITYIEPEVSNRAAIGLDMAHETNRYTAAKKAMTTGTTQITGPIVLVQDEEKTPGFLFYHPFYSTLSTPAEARREAEFHGLVYAPFIMRKLMDGTLANVNRRIQLRISDGGTVLYDELEASNDNYDPSPLFKTTMVMPMYGRQWSFDIQTTQLFNSLNVSRQPGIILISGIVIDGFILSVFILLARARTKAEIRAENMTRHFDNEARKLNAVLNTVSEAIITTDEKGFISSMNPTAVQLFGNYRVGEPINGLFADNFVKQVADAVQGISREERFSFETLAFDRQSESFPAHVGIGRAKQDQHTLFTYTIRDLTSERSSDTAKSQFVSTVSHELRTPLTAISGAALLLKNQLINAAEPGSQKMLDIIVRNTERLSLLVSDLLDIEGFTTGSIHLSPAPADLAKIARKAVNDCITYATGFNVSLEFVDKSSNGTVTVDRDRIGQVLLNLISNAIKFSPEGSVVTIEMINPDQQTVCVRVIDQGEGIPEKYRTRAFSRFSQVDSSDSRQKAGTGLGLSISKAIIDLHGGTIDYETELGQGTTFHFCLALATEAELSNQAADQPTE